MSVAGLLLSIMKAFEILVGTPVIYWAVMEANGEKSTPYKTRIRSNFWVLGSGQVVCKIEGKSGGVSISHLDPITSETLKMAQRHGVQDISDKLKIRTLTVDQSIEQGYTEAIADGGDYPELIKEIKNDDLINHTYWLIEKDGYSFRVNSKNIKERILDFIRDQDQVYDEEDQLGEAINAMPDFVFEQFTEALNRAMEPIKWRGSTDIVLEPTLV